MTDWGPTCARCGADEFRIDGYCTVECRDLHEVELERDAAEERLGRAEEVLREIEETPTGCLAEHSQLARSYLSGEQGE